MRQLLASLARITTNALALGMSMLIALLTIDSVGRVVSHPDLVPPEPALLTVDSGWSVTLMAALIVFGGLALALSAPVLWRQWAHRHIQRFEEGHAREQSNA